MDPLTSAGLGLVCFALAVAFIGLFVLRMWLRALKKVVKLVFVLFLGTVLAVAVGGAAMIFLYGDQLPF